MTTFKSYGSAAVAVSLLAAACAAPSGDAVGSSQDAIDSAAQCSTLIGEMAFYDLALQSEIARGCLNPGRIESFSLTILNVAQVAYGECTSAYGITDAWFADFSNHVKNAWRAQTDCIQPDAIATRCPLVKVGGQHREVNDAFCSSTHDVAVYARECKNQEDVAACQQYFGGYKIVLDKAFCDKQVSIEISECDLVPVVKPAPLPSGGAPGTGGGNVGGGSVGGGGPSYPGNTGASTGRGTHNKT